MRIPEFKLPLCLGLLCVLAVVESSFAQGTLIGPETQNGSFEEGVLAPWGSGHDVRVVNDPAFASEGDYYATFQSSLVRPVLAGQNLLPNPYDGLLFLLTFDARLGNPRLELVSVYMSARTPEGNSLRASVIPVTAPPLSALYWQSFEYQLLMPEAWDGTVTFGVSFTDDQPLGGVPHYAYLDNVVLTQIPEPSALALLGLGGLLLAARLRRRSGAQAGSARTKDHV